MRNLNNSIVVALAMIGSAATVWAADSRVSGVEAKRVESGLEISVAGQNLERPKVVTARGGSLYILEFRGVLDGKKQSLTVGSGGVKDIQVMWFTPRPPRVRVAIRLEQGSEAELISRDGTWIVLVRTSGASAPQPLEPQAGDLSPTGELPALKTAPTLPMPDENLRDVPKVVGGTATEDLTEAQRNRKNKVLKPKSPPPVELEATLPVTPVALGTASVGLDFVNTDVVQVLKALALQTKQNILIAAETSSVEKPNRVTISLTNVSLEQALNYVTAMAGLRYVKVDNAYVVAPDRTFSEVVRKIVNKNSTNMEYRVVNLTSGEADLIRDSTMRALPTDGLSGFYEIVVSDDDKAPVAANAVGSAEKPAEPLRAPGATKSRANFLVLVGEPGRLNIVERYVRDMDSKLAAASASDDISTVVIPIQSGEAKQVREAIERQIQSHPRSSSFMIRESDASDAAKQSGAKVISIMGPKSQLPKLDALARELDKGYASAKGVTFADGSGGIQMRDEVITLSHTEPTLIMQRVKERFPNVRVWTLPDPVTPQVTGSVSSSSSTQDGGSGQSKEGGNGAEGEKSGGSSPQSGGTSSSTKTASSQGITGHEPMRLLIQAPAQVVAEVREFVKMIDIEPPTIALEMRVLELSREDSVRLGLDFSFLNSIGGTIFRFNQGSGDTSGTAGNFSGNFGSRDGTSFNFLSTLDQIDNGRRLIARPNALIQDGRGTKIFVGDTIRYVKSIQSTQNGVTAQTEELKVGVNFDIASRVSPDGKIKLTMSALFNILKGFTSVPGGGSLPQTADRSTQQFIAMEDGETVAIGGLIQDQDRKSFGGVPFLKDLPLLGRLFGRTDNLRTRTEIVFFVTAKLVNKQNRPFIASPRTSMKDTPDPMSGYLMDGSGKKKTGG